jgi:arylsulfatase
MEALAKNLVLVSYDSVRRDVAFAGKLPALERLRRRGTTFRQCVSSAPLTPVSHASVFTGLQPYHHGIRHLFKESLRSNTPTLAGTLSRAGFDTSAVVSCPGLNRWYGMDDGFAHYDDEVPKLPDGTDPLQTVDVKLRGRALKRAPLVVRRSLEYLEARHPERYFHFIHFFDAHWPYEPPEIVPGERGANPYEDEVRYLDHYFGQWLQRMERAGRLDDTLIVLFGDHGEDLSGWYPGDKGGSEGAHPEEMGHGALLYDQTLMVPLIFSHPRLPRREIQEQVRLVDIMPTCISLLGLPAPAGCDGASLARSVLGGSSPGLRPAYSETFYPREQVEASQGRLDQGMFDEGAFEWTRNMKAVRFPNGVKAIFHIDSDVVEAYDLNADPREERNLLARCSGDASEQAAGPAALGTGRITGAAQSQNDSGPLVRGREESPS